MFGSTQYVRVAVDSLEGYLMEKNIKLPVNYETPIHISYRPEPGISP